MRKPWRRGPLAGVLASVLMTSWALPGCTRSGSQVAAEVVADTQLQQILQHVPADTPATKNSNITFFNMCYVCK